VGCFLKNIYFKKQITLNQILQESSNILKHKWSKINQNFNRSIYFQCTTPVTPTDSPAMAYLHFVRIARRDLLLRLNFISRHYLCPVRSLSLPLSTRRPLHHRLADCFWPHLINLCNCTCHMNGREVALYGPIRGYKSARAKLTWIYS